MNTEEQARILMAKDRQKAEHLNESMHNRAEEEIENKHTSETEEKSRELLTKERQHQNHIQENMHNRTEDEIQ